jgi:parvulin-like peptidyl-prolyl isomerase
LVGSEKGGAESSSISSEAVQAGGTTSAGETTSPPLAAIVNQQPIYLEDYERELAAYERALALEGYDLESDEAKAELIQIRGDLLESMIEMKLIEQAAEELGIALSDDEIQAQVTEDVESGGGEEALGEWLEATGQTREEYTAAVRDALLVQKVLEAVTEVPTETEQIRLLQIVLDSEVEAQQAREAIDSGAEFGVVAKERSLDEFSREQGGDLGWLPRGVLEPTLEDVAFSLEPGSVSQPISAPDGYWYILHVAERDESRPLTADVLMELRFAAFKQWLQDRLESAEVQRFLGD